MQMIENGCLKYYNQNYGKISKNENISTCEEMNEFLSDENIKKLITK